MTPNLTCTLCNGPVTSQQVSFLDDGKLWSLKLYLCKRPSCLERRGATCVEHRAEKRLSEGVS